MEKKKLMPSAESFGNRFSEKKLGRWVWFGLAMLLALSLWKTVSWKNHPKQRGVTKPVLVRFVSANQKDFPIYLDGLGTVQAYNSVLVNARVSGQIQEVRFQEGQEVRAGDILAIVDPRIYQAQYDQAVAKKMQDQAQLENARTVLARNQQLLQKAVVDQQTYDTQKYLVAQLEATVLADEANAESQKTQLDYTMVTAPISGRAGLRQVDVGNLVTGNSSSNANGASSIVVINQIQPIYVNFTLPQQNLSQIRQALVREKTPPVVVLDRNQSTILDQGILSVVDNQIDAATATIRLKASFENKDYKLWPGQFVNVRLLVETRPHAVVVPTEAVQLGPNGSYVYVISKDHRAMMHSIVTGPSEEGLTLITSGLSAGDKVITEGQYQLAPNVPVVTMSTKSSESEKGS